MHTPLHLSALGAVCATSLPSQGEHATASVRRTDDCSSSCRDRPSYSPSLAGTKTEDPKLLGLVPSRDSAYLVALRGYLVQYAHIYASHPQFGLLLLHPPRAGNLSPGIAAFSPASQPNTANYSKTAAPESSEAAAQRFSKLGLRLIQYADNRLSRAANAMPTPTLFRKFRIQGPSFRNFLNTSLWHKPPTPARQRLKLDEPKDPAVFAHKIRAGYRGVDMPLRALHSLRQAMPEKLGNLQASNPAYTFAMSPRAWAQATSSCVKSVTSKCGMASPSSASVAFVIFTVAVIFISPTLGCARSILAQGIASSPMRRLMTPVDA